MCTRRLRSLFKIMNKCAYTIASFIFEKTILKLRLFPIIWINKGSDSVECVRPFVCSNADILLLYIPK